MKNKKNIFVETYGCTSNKFDSERVIGILREHGFNQVSNEYEADYIIINTCAVKSQTEEKIISRLSKLSNNNKKLIITGCLTKVNLERIKNTVPDFSAIIGPQSIHKIFDIINEIENGNKNIIQTTSQSFDKLLLPSFSYFHKVIHIVKISEGCASNCSFCATRLARGYVKSYRPSIIRDSIIRGIKNNFKEFHLTSEDMSAYGKDIGINLPQLIESITRINGKFFIRIGMMNPLHLKSFLEDLIKVYKHEKIFKFLHLPVQSGSDKVLKDMRRGYKVKDFLYYVNRFIEEIPDITLSTDIIVGFPTENQSDFNKTISLIKKVKPDVLNISRFSPRKGTLAEKLERLKPEIVNKRSAKLHNLIKKLQNKKNKKWIGWKGEVLIDEIGNKNLLSRNIFYKPIVTEGKIGEFKNLEIIDAYSTYFIGK